MLYYLNVVTYAEPTMAKRIADFMVYLVYIDYVFSRGGGLLGCSWESWSSTVLYKSTLLLLYGTVRYGTIEETMMPPLIAVGYLQYYYYYHYFFEKHTFLSQKEFT